MNWASLEKQIINWRRDFHTYPESGWTEFRTSSIVAERLESLGYKVSVGTDVVEKSAIMGRPDDDIERHIERAIEQGGIKKWIDKMAGYTGVVGVLETGRPGPVTALRFDIDCVDVVESSDEKHRPAREGFASVNEGCMHSCGHDGHTAIGLGLAEALMEVRDSLTGRIKLLFQPAEEGVRGGYAMTERGLLDDVDCLYTMHLGLGMPSGTIVAGTKGFLCTTKFDVKYIGRGAHAGGEPQEGHNALLAAATAALNLHAIAPHRDGMTRINVGVLNAGVGRNVIAPQALMKVETRGETNEIASYMYSRAERIIKAAADMYEVKFHIDKMGEAVSSTSHPELVKKIVEVAESTKGVNRVLKESQMSGSDDATWMMNRVQSRGGRATYMIIGAETAAGHHNEFFDFDESVMLPAVRMLRNLVLKVSE